MSDLKEIADRLAVRSRVESVSCTQLAKEIEEALSQEGKEVTALWLEEAEKLVRAAKYALSEDPGDWKTGLAEAISNFQAWKEKMKQ